MLQSTRGSRTKNREELLKPPGHQRIILFACRWDEADWFSQLRNGEGEREEKKWHSFPLATARRGLQEGRGGGGAIVASDEE